MTLGCGEARLDAGAVGPDDRIAREDTAPAVVAAHIDALPGAGLRHCRPCRTDGAADRQIANNERPRDDHAVLHLIDWGCRYVVELSGFRFKDVRGAPIPAGSRS